MINPTADMFRFFELLDRVDDTTLTAFVELFDPDSAVADRALSALKAVKMSASDGQ